MGPEGGVVGEVPLQGHLAPVPHSADNNVLHMPLHIPIERTRRTGPLLGEVQVFGGEAVVDAAHGANVAGVHVECSSIDVLGRIGIVVNCRRVIGPVEVVVIDYNFGADAGCSKCGTQIVLDEVSLVLSCKIHAGIVARVQWFVLRSNGVDADSLSLHGLDVLHKILGIRSIVLWLETPAHALPVVLHPGGRTPRSRYDLNLRVYGQNAFQNGNQVRSIWSNAELVLVHVSLP